MVGDVPAPWIHLLKAAAFATVLPGVFQPWTFIAGIATLFVAVTAVNFLFTRTLPR
jgi:hypothetical protein